MATTVSSASMSLDGFVALPDDTPGPLFDWYDNGDVEIENAGDLPPFHVSAASAAYWQDWRSSLGALVVGRRLFDVTDGWHGTHPLDVPVVVVTHEPPTGWSYPGSERFEFVAGVPEAIARAAEIAGDASVGVAAGTIATQALAAGLLDRVAIDLVPVVLGAGRPYFTDGVGLQRLGDPVVQVPGDRVTHLVFPVER